MMLSSNPAAGMNMMSNKNVIWFLYSLTFG